MELDNKINVNTKEIDLIKKLISENKYYEGNEDLLSLFCEDVYKKSYLLFRSVRNYEYLISYLNKIVNNSIISILKEKSRTKCLNLKSKYMSSSDECRKDKTTNKNGLCGVYDIYKLDIPFDESETFNPTGWELSRVLDLLGFINAENLDKKYLQIFSARYIQNKSTEAIAYEFNLSEVEVYQRLIDLAEIINKNINL